MDKQTEEMYQEFLDYKASTPCEVFSYRGMCENFIKLGYTKIDYKNINDIDLMIFAGKRFAQIPEGAVVLPRVQYEEMKRYNSISETTRLIKKARKETAEKCYYGLASRYYDKEMLEIFRDYIAREFGVAIKE